MGTLLYIATGEGVFTAKANGGDTWEAEQKGLSAWDSKATWRGSGDGALSKAWSATPRAKSLSPGR